METFTSGSVENSYREVHYGYKGHNVNIYGTYENSWGGHHFKATAGGQYEDYRSTSARDASRKATAGDSSPRRRPPGASAKSRSSSPCAT